MKKVAKTTKPATSTRIHGFTQKAFVFNAKRQFLILRRSKTHPHNKFQWDLPGGDVEFGEDPQQSIKREIFEESGLRVKNLKPFSTFASLNSQGEYWVTLGYTCQATLLKVKLSWEHDQFRWVTKADFPKLTTSKRFLSLAKKLPIETR